MTETIITILVIIGLILVLAIAWSLYKSGFRLEELKVKLGLAEATMKREAGNKKPAAPAAAAPTAVEQRAVITTLA